MTERPLRHRLKVTRVNSAAGDGVAALTHAGVVAQTTFVQVRVGERVAAGDPLGLDTEKTQVRTRQHPTQISPRMLERPGDDHQNKLTGSKTSMRQSRCTASCVAPSDSM